MFHPAHTAQPRLSALMLDNKSRRRDCSCRRCARLQAISVRLGHLAMM